MSTLAVNTITNAAGGNTAQINGMTPTAQSLQGFRNRLINSDMRIDQRNAGASVTVTDSAPYTIDRWWAYSAPTSKFTLQQNAGSVTPPVGFKNYLGGTSSSAYSVTAADQFFIAQSVEGYNINDLEWGTANAKTVNLSFQVYSSLTGTFAGSIQNNANNRSYVFSYSIPVANTWTTISITITGDTTGTWLTTNGAGLLVILSIGAGSNYNATAGVWSAGNFKSVSGAVSVVGTSGATFYITGVQLEAGSVATPFERIDYGRQLIQCQRYYARLNATYSNFAAFSSGMVVSTTLAEFYVKYPVQMRGAATVTQSNTKINAGLAGPATSSISAVYAGTDSCYLALNASGMTVGYGAVLVANNNASAYIDLSSEL
jgi:hypothetical protein